MWVRRAVLALIVLLAVSAAGAVSIDAGLYRHRIHPGVKVWGVEVGGMDAEAAKAALTARAARVLKRAIAVRSSSATVAIVPGEAGVTLDANATAAAAARAADGGAWWGDLRRRVSLWMGGADVPPVLTVSDQGAWEQAVDEVSLSTERLARDARLLMTDEGPKAVAAEEGVLLDRSALKSRVLEAALSGADQVKAPVSVVSPRVTTDDARRSLQAARLAFSAPLELGYQGRTFEITGRELSKVAAVREGGAGSDAPLTFDTPEAQALLEQRLAPVGKAPVDAQIVPAETGKGFTVAPSKDGTVIEWDGLLAAVTRAALSPDRRYVPIPTTPAYPKISTEDAEQLGVRHEIASFTTYFSSSNMARVKNIRQVAAYLNGVVVRPGATFSFNETVGPRTKAAGFDEAPVIRDGILTPGVGGGICQVSTTLFNAVFFAGLPVVERKPHSFFIDHYPVGRDATVSYGETDLRFRNDSDNVLLISVTADDRSVRVSLAATEWDRSVTYKTSPFREVVRPSSTQEHPRRLRDPALETGKTSAVEKGVDGRTVDVERTVKGPGGQVLAKDVFTSVYEPKDYVVRVGG